MAHGNLGRGKADLPDMAPVCASEGNALGENVRVAMMPDSVTVVSLHVVSTEAAGGVIIKVDGREVVSTAVEPIPEGSADAETTEGVEESVKTVVVPDCVMVVSLHVVSIDVAAIGVGVGVGTEENVTTVKVPDCVIVLSLHVVSKELGAVENGPVGFMLVIVGNGVDPEGSADGERGVAPSGPVEAAILTEGDPDDVGTPPAEGPADGIGVVPLLIGVPAEAEGERVASEPVTETRGLVGNTPPDVVVSFQGHGSSNVATPVVTEVSTMFETVTR